MFHLHNISKIRCFLTTEACKLLVHALVTLRLDYCNSILYGCNQSVLKRLHFLQNYATRLVQKSQNSVTSPPISKIFTGCLWKHELSSNYLPSYSSAYMELDLTISLKYSAAERRALA